MNLEEITQQIVSENGNDRKTGFYNLGLLPKEEQKKVIESAFRTHISDDRLLEYNNSSIATTELLEKVSELGYAHNFTGEITELFDLCKGTPTSKARKVYNACVSCNKDLASLKESDYVRIKPKREKTTFWKPKN